MNWIHVPVSSSHKNSWNCPKTCSIFAFSRLVERPDWKSRDQGSQPTTKLAGSVSAGSPRRIPLLNLPHSH
uniref:Uncharacterized protein n=1 Tax=Anguilla anguilla TaxID=7936 RepID=A0A0E9XBX8_ANGAN